MTDSNQGYPTGALLSGIIPDVYGSGTSGPIIVPTGAVTNVDGSDRQFVIDYTTSTAGISGDTVNINGGNDQFVVLVDSPARGTGCQRHDQRGRRQRQVRRWIFKSSAADASQNGNNVVNVGGGNNQFVVQYDNTAGSTGTPTGNNVSVDGGNNSFVVSYEYPDRQQHPWRSGAGERREQPVRRGPQQRVVRPLRLQRLERQRSGSRQLARRQPARRELVHPSAAERHVRRHHVAACPAISGVTVERQQQPVCRVQLGRQR